MLLMGRIAYGASSCDKNKWQRRFCWRRSSYGRTRTTIWHRALKVLEGMTPGTEWCIVFVANRAWMLQLKYSCRTKGLLTSVLSLELEWSAFFSAANVSCQENTLRKTTLGNIHVLGCAWEILLFCWQDGARSVLVRS